MDVSEKNVEKCLLKMFLTEDEVLMVKVGRRKVDKISSGIAYKTRSSAVVVRPRDASCH